MPGKCNGCSYWSDERDWIFRTVDDGYGSCHHPSVGVREKQTLPSDSCDNWTDDFVRSTWNGIESVPSHNDGHGVRCWECHFWSPVSRRWGDCDKMTGLRRTPFSSTCKSARLSEK